MACWCFPAYAVGHLIAGTWIAIKASVVGCVMCTTGLSNCCKSHSSESESKALNEVLLSSGMPPQIPAAADPAIERPLAQSISEIAQEDIYRHFMGGKLVYRPDPKSDAGKIEFLFAKLSNLLEGEFDLSSCGDTGQYLSINTGYKKGKIAKNANKVEIWIAPRFLIEKQLGTSASHFKDIISDWNGSKAPVGIFWTWGGWDNSDWFDYLTANSMDEIGSENLFEKFKGRRWSQRGVTCVIPRGWRAESSMSCFVCEL